MRHPWESRGDLLRQGEREAAEHNVIYLLEKCARAEVKGGKVQGQGSAKEMRTIPEALREDCPRESRLVQVSPRELSCRPGNRVLLGKGKEEVQVRV